MPDISNAFDLARDDIMQGLSPAFEPISDDDGDGFEMGAHFRDIDTIVTDDLAAVPWQYRCQHVDWFQSAPPSQAVLTIRGTTIVDGRGRDVLYHRYVDWLAVYTAIGYTLYQRQMVDAVDWESLNFPRIPHLQ
jgi:hypothetical protein